MRSQAALVLAITVTGFVHSAFGQMTYIAQQRSVYATYNWAQQQQSCTQQHAAVDFRPFAQAADCGGFANSSQYSILEPYTVRIAGNANTSGGGGTISNNSSTTASIDIAVGEGMVFTFRGMVGGFPNQSQARLTGAAGNVFNITSTNPNQATNLCGALASGNYTFFVRSQAGQGTSANHDVVLQISRLGDIELDGVVNVSDLLAVINAWGACGSPQSCAADVNCDGVVNVNDLLAVISNWG